MYSIENNSLKVDVTAKGGCLKGIFDKTRGIQLLWQGDEKSWEDSDIVIFPMIARLQDGYYTHNGQRYDMRIHGIACYDSFDIVSHTGNSIALRLVSTAESMKEYPFSFSLDVIYTVTGKKLTVRYEVCNTGAQPMPFCLGGHPGFNLDFSDGQNICETAGNLLKLCTPQELTAYTLDSSNHFITGEKSLGFTESFDLQKALFRNDAVILKQLKGNVEIVRKNGVKIRFYPNNAPVFAFWSHPTYGGYVCLEPWLGLPDTAPATREITQKPLVKTLPPDGRFAYEYAVEIL